MKSRFICIVILVLQVVACTPEEVISPLQALKVEESVLLLGELYESEVDCVIPFVNRSNQPLVVSSLKGNCSCTSIMPKSFTVEPGEQVDVTVHLNLTGKSGPFLVSVTARSPNDHFVKELLIEGQIIDLFKDPMPTISTQSQYPQDRIVVEHRLNEPVVGAQFETEPPFEHVEAILTDKLMRLELTLSDSCPFGRLHSRVRVKAKTSTGRDVNLFIPVIFERVKPYSMRPSLMNFGRISLDDHASSALTLSFNSPFSEVAVQSEPPGIEATITNDLRKDKFSTVNLRIKLITATVGFYSEQVTLNAEIEGRVLQISVPVTYYCYEN